MPVPCFSCFLFQKIHFWKYSWNCTKIYGDFLFSTTKYLSEGELEGKPKVQVRPLPRVKVDPRVGPAPAPGTSPRRCC